jgi:hypothetical protein
MRCHSVGCGMPGRMAVANATGYAEHRTRSHDAVIRVYDEAGNVIEPHERISSDAPLCPGASGTRCDAPLRLRETFAGEKLGL